jgi:4-hydroxymandelate oxidase
VTTTRTILPICLPDFEAAAKEKLPHVAWEYLSGGAGDELTLARNRAKLDELLLAPRVMRDVSLIDTGTTLLGRRHAAPILLAPTGYHRVFHDDGENATARGAAMSGVTMIVSTPATTALDEVARASDAPKWYQIYVQRDRGWTRELIAKAEKSGYEAFVLTVDTPVLGARDREKRARFELPPHLRMPNFPALPHGYKADDHHVPDSIYNPFLDPTLTWDAIPWLREHTRLPVLVKGILSAEDARLAVERGAAGVIVSNHGGRNLDTVPATIEALPGVVAAVAGRAPVLLDGGVRRGTDVVKSLALGASGVLIGRLYLWGLAAGGDEGVARVVKLLRLELEAAMALLGVTSIAAVDRSVLWKPA